MFCYCWDKIVVGVLFRIEWLFYFWVGCRRCGDGLLIEVVFMIVYYEVCGFIVVIIFDNLLVNGLGFVICLVCVVGVECVEVDLVVMVIVIIGVGKVFLGGVDIKEFGSFKVLVEFNLLSLIGVVESCSKLVVVVIYLVCMGGGLELVLGCYYCVV